MSSSIAVSVSGRFNFIILGSVHLVLFVYLNQYRFHAQTYELLSCPQNSPRSENQALATDGDYARFNGEINDISRRLPNYDTSSSPLSILCILINNE